jgi:hypothetical protein
VSLLACFNKKNSSPIELNKTQEMSALVLTSFDGYRSKAMALSSPGEEFNNLLHWLTTNSIAYVDSESQALKPGLYCYPAGDVYIVFQALPVPDWDDKDPPLFYQQVYWLAWLRLPKESEEKEKSLFSVE